MKIIDWNTAIISSKLFGTYSEILLCLSVALSIISIVTCFLLLRQVTKLKNNYIIQSEFITKTRAKFLANQQEINRLFRMVEPNVGNIENLQQQMALVHELLGTVMGASDFIATGFDTPADRVEEIRERLKWERERRRLNQTNESDFYKD